MDVENDLPSPEEAAGELESRPPTLDDLVGLCRRLNELGARFKRKSPEAKLRAFLNETKR